MKKNKHAIPFLKKIKRDSFLVRCNIKVIVFRAKLAERRQLLVVFNGHVISPIGPKMYIFFSGRKFKNKNSLFVCFLILMKAKTHSVSWFKPLFLKMWFEDISILWGYSTCRFLGLTSGQLWETKNMCVCMDVCVSAYFIIHVYYIYI